MGARSAMLVRLVSVLLPGVVAGVCAVAMLGQQLT